jgi:hypothetical protein
MATPSEVLSNELWCGYGVVMVWLWCGHGVAGASA